MADTRVMPAIKSMAGAELTHFVTRDQVRAAQLADKHGISRYSSRAENAWLDPNVDAI